MVKAIVMMGATKIRNYAVSQKKMDAIRLDVFFTKNRVAYKVENGKGFFFVLFQRSLSFAQIFNLAKPFHTTFFFSKISTSLEKAKISFPFCHCTSLGRH